MLLRPPQKSTYLPHVTLSNISLPEEPPTAKHSLIIIVLSGLHLPASLLLGQRALEGNGMSNPTKRSITKRELKILRKVIITLPLFQLMLTGYWQIFDSIDIDDSKTVLSIPDTCH